LVETKRELRVKRGISAESPKKAAIPFTDCGLYLWCEGRTRTGTGVAHYPLKLSLAFSATD
jgi:hypothetical protein